MSDFDDFSEIDPQAVSRRVKELREKLNMTQIDLARRSQSSQQTICNLERGAVKVPRNIPMIAAVLGVKPRYLLTGISELGVPVVKNDEVKKTLDLLLKQVDLDAGTKFVTPTKTNKSDMYPNMLAFTVADSAMKITEKGDVVILDTEKKVLPGMLVAVEQDNVYTLRKARVLENSSYTYISDNEDYPTINSSSTVFVVTEIRKLLV